MQKPAIKRNAVHLRNLSSSPRSIRVRKRGGMLPSSLQATLDSFSPVKHRLKCLLTVAFMNNVTK